MKRLVLPLIAVGILSACAGASTDDSATPATPAAPAVTESPVSTTAAGQQSGGSPTDVPEALKFSAPLVGGGDIELTTLAGRPVLLWFWAPW